MSSNSIRKSGLFLLTGLLYANTACSRNTELLRNTEEEDTRREAEETGCRHEFSLWGAAGISTLRYRPGFGERESGTDGAFGWAYTCFFHPEWGVSSGMEYALYQSALKLTGLTDALETRDIFGNRIVYHSRIDGYREKQRIGLLNIPLALLYQTGNRHKFYVSGGMKLGLPLSGEYESGEAVITASGYYPDYNQTEIWQNDLGYGILPVKGSRGKLNSGLSLTGTLETGMKWNTGASQYLYTGIYLDYGLSNILRSPEKRFTGYNTENPAEPLVNGTLVSRYGESAKAFTDKAVPFALGLKIKWAFSLDRKPQSSFLLMRDFDDDDFYEFTPPRVELPVQKETVPQKEEPAQNSGEESSPETDTPEAEREAYLASAAERRQRYRDLNASTDIERMGNYDLGRVTLTAGQHSTLDEYVRLTEENPGMELDITGHTCDLGADELNLRIGRERADLAKDYLVEKGIAPSRIATFSKGETEPLFPNNNEENRRKNRRLEIVIKK
jgi:outer membrane protein OmpA-like peptidoglycan-associated protein